MTAVPAMAMMFLKVEARARQRGARKGRSREMVLSSRTSLGAPWRRRPALPYSPQVMDADDPSARAGIAPPRRLCSPPTPRDCWGRSLWRTMGRHNITRRVCACPAAASCAQLCGPRLRYPWGAKSCPAARRSPRGCWQRPPSRGGLVGTLAHSTPSALLLLRILRGWASGARRRRGLDTHACLCPAQRTYGMADRRRGGPGQSRRSCGGGGQVAADSPGLAGTPPELC